MLYTILVNYYVEFSIALLIITFFFRRKNTELRTKLLYLYGLIASLGFLLDLQWVSGVVFGFILLELGSVYRQYVDIKLPNKGNDEK
ncbi:hypothetical protein [Marinomonas algicola]|uniref:hypothetical protein n=1 Tax=Marinomonas algicola TaxID=2773454 RepID=UPI0017482133|nr:hypothetical protein [Marinomonas algicola]